MKIFIPSRRNGYLDVMARLFQEAGIDVVHDLSEPVDFVYFGINFPGAYDNTPEKYKTHSGIQLTDKSVLNDTLIAAGLNVLEVVTIQNESTIRDFDSTAVFIKPMKGAGSLTPYTFVYKSFDSKDELINTINQEVPDFFTVNEDGSSICSKHVIQKAILPDTDGYVHQYYVPVYINGQGTIVTEGLGKENMILNELNDIDDTVYPLRHMRDSVIRNSQDQTDQYNIIGQLTQLVEHCQIRNTPMHTQWLIDDTGNSYLIDVSYQFQRATLILPGFQSAEFITDKIQYVYDIKPTIELPLTGWVGMADYIITSDKTATVEYAASQGLYQVTTWPLVSGPSSLTIPFAFVFGTEQECLDKIELVRTYIANNTIN
jgi:hypothetical protein